MVEWIYFIGVALFIVPISRFSMVHLDDGEEDTETTVMSIVMGFTLCWVWPLIVVGALVYPLVKPKAK